MSTISSSISNLIWLQTSFWIALICTLYILLPLYFWNTFNVENHALNNLGKQTYLIRTSFPCVLSHIFYIYIGTLPHKSTFSIGQLSPLHIFTHNQLLLHVYAYVCNSYIDIHIQEYINIQVFIQLMSILLFYFIFSPHTSLSNHICIILF